MQSVSSRSPCMTPSRTQPTAYSVTLFPSTACQLWQPRGDSAYSTQPTGPLARLLPRGRTSTDARSRRTAQCFQSRDKRHARRAAAASAPRGLHPGTRRTPIAAGGQFCALHSPPQMPNTLPNRPKGPFEQGPPDAPQQGEMT